jgi:hypothetical protein
MNSGLGRAGRSLLAKIAELIASAIALVIFLWLMYHVFIPGIASGVIHTIRVPTPAPTVSSTVR